MAAEESGPVSDESQPILMGGWAHAAHFCENYRDFGGLKAPTRRRVRPILFGSSPLPGPILVAIEDEFDVRGARVPVMVSVTVCSTCKRVFISMK